MNTQQSEDTKYPCYTTTRKTASFLALRVSSSRSYFLPYYHLLAGEHNVEESGGIKTESLTLEFAAYVVRIEGTSLSRLIAEIREMKVKSVRLLPEPTNPLNTKMTKPEVIVTRIEVAYRHDEN